MRTCMRARLLIRYARVQNPLFSSIQKSVKGRVHLHKKNNRILLQKKHAHHHSSKRFARIMPSVVHVVYCGA